MFENDPGSGGGSDKLIPNSKLQIVKFIDKTFFNLSKKTCKNNVMYMKL